MTSTQKAIKMFALIFGTFLTISICGMILNILFSLMNWSNIFKNNDASDIITEQTYKNIKNVTLDLKATSLEIVKGPEFKIEQLNNEDNMSIKTKDSSLYITEKSKLFWKNRKSKIKIFLNNTLNNLDIEMGAGTIFLEDITSNELHLELGAGSTKLDNVRFMETEIEGGAGKIEMDNVSLNNLDLQAGVGSTNIEGEITGNSEIECGVGSVKLSLIGSLEDYTIKTEKGIGSINIDGSSSEGTVGNGPNKLFIEGGVGSINLNFKNSISG